VEVIGRMRSSFVLVYDRLCLRRDLEIGLMVYMHIILMYYLLRHIPDSVLAGASA
jgi:hypothetical protein